MASPRGSAASICATLGLHRAACPCARHRRGSSRHGSGSGARGTLRARASRAGTSGCAANNSADARDRRCRIAGVSSRRNEVMRFRDEHAVGAEHFDDAVDDGVHVLDMGEAVGRGDDARRAVLALAPRARRRCRNSAGWSGCRGSLAILRDIGRLDAENAVAALLEIRDQRAVVGADVDDEIVGLERRASSTIRRRARRNCRAAAWSCRWCRDIPAGR